MQIEFLNTDNNYELEELVKQDVDNFFAEASAAVFGDMSLKWGEQEIYFYGIQIVRFSENLLFSAFAMSFRDHKSTKMWIKSLNKTQIRLWLEMSGSQIRATFRFGSGAKLTYNGKDYIGGDKLVIDFDVVEFNALCGALYEHTIDYVEDLLGHIDGVRDYFGTLPFDIVPFYEGFALKD